MIHVFLDTNIILDIALERKPFDEQAFGLLQLMEQQKIKAYLSSLTIVNLNYVMSKIKGKESSLLFIKELLQIFEITNLDKSVLIKAIQSNFTDFEDAVQNFSAMSSKVECIITRNAKDYSKSELEVVEPATFLERF